MNYMIRAYKKIKRIFGSAEIKSSPYIWRTQEERDCDFYAGVKPFRDMAVAMGFDMGLFDLSIANKKKLSDLWYEDIKELYIRYQK